jgi:hypothetical protein
MSGYGGADPGVGAPQRFTFIATAGQTTFSGVDANGLTLNYKAPFVEAIVDGNWLTPDEYTATDGSSVVTPACTAGMKVYIFAFNVYSPADGLTVSQNGADILDKIKFRSYLPNPGALFGLTMSTAGSSATLTVAAGFAADSTNVKLMRLASSLAKTTSAWTAGAGGALDTGSLANNTWYHWYVIYNPTTDTTDVLFSASASAPTLPSGYTLFRRIGAWATNGSAQWQLIRQKDDTFLYDSPVMSLPQTTYGVTTALLTNVYVPTGVKVDAIFQYVAFYGATGAIVYVSSPEVTDLSPSGTTAMTLVTTSNANYAAGQMTIRTNTSGQIRERCNVADAGRWIFTTGWTDTRGKLG